MSALTLATLRARTFALLGESESEAAYWSAQEITDHINDTYREIARDTGALEVSVTLPITAGVQEVEGDETLRWPPLRVAYDGRRLANTTKWELDRVESDWENQTGYVSHYVTTLESPRLFRLYKAPESTAGQYEMSSEFGTVVQVTGATMNAEYGTDIAWSVDGTAATFTSEFGVTVDVDDGESGLVVHAKRIPPALSADTDEPELPHWSHMALAFGAAARALMKHGEQRNPALAQVYDAMVKDYTATLAGLVASRTPERTRAMRAAPRRVPRRPLPTDQLIEG